MKKLSLLSLGLLLSIPAISFAETDSDALLEQEILSGKAASTQTNMDLNKDLNNATSGLGRFRFGVSLGGGYYKSASVDNYPNMSGLAVELGLYTLVNPIRDWADIELGVRGLYVFPHDKKSENQRTRMVEEKSYSGLASGSAYAGLVFRFPGASSAIATGVYQDFVAKSQFSEKQIVGINLKDSLKYKPGQGAYIEYQWTGKDNLIPFARFTYGTYKSEYQTGTQVQTNREKLYGLVLGAKF
ncbi:hypothetical protein [Haemophilus parahaemolyticus]